MKSLFALLSLLIAGPAAAGTVAVMVFTGSTPVETVAANGVIAARSGEFVLYSHGIGQSVSSMAVPRQAGLVAASASAAAVQAPADQGCYGQPVPARAGLPAQTALKRLTWWPLVHDAECRYRLPGGLLDALVMQESRYSVAALSPARAGGLTQLMPGTALSLRVTDRFEPAANVDGGARYLRSMLDRYRSVPFALAAYNAGPGAVDQSGGIPRNRETPSYVTRVLDYWTRAAWVPGAGAPAVTTHVMSINFSGSSSE